MKLNIRNTSRVALRSLITNKTRSALTTLGIIIGVMAVILLVSFGSGIEKLITQQFEDLGTNLLFVMPGRFQFRDSREGGPPGVATNKLTPKDAERVARKAPGISATLPIMTTNATVTYRREETNTFIIGTTEEYETFRNSPVQQGKWFGKKDVDSGKRVAVAGTTVVENLFGTKNPVGEKVSIAGQKYLVIGVLGSKGATIGSDQDDQLIVPISSLQRQFNIDKLSYFYAQVSEGTDLEVGAQQIKEILGKRLDEDEFSVINSQELLMTFQNILGTITAALGGIAAISLLVGGIGIMNVMLVSVIERTREIGLRKAVGATPKTILFQFLMEAVILSMLGGVIGTFLGVVIGIIANNFLPVHTPLWAVLVAFGVSAAVGIIFGVYPASRAAKLSPIEALRYE
ncbi:ABC transporter permease [Patescibacteria group bacterium]|nr:ABC transporter permease [Patescibacteria group bacterium]